MKLVKFLKLINNKIDKYEKMTQTNPFVVKRPITLIWVEKKQDE